MIANLEFTYPSEDTEFQWPAQKSEPRPQASEKCYDLPTQMEFQLAAPPQLLQESPVPLQFSRLREATKVQRKGKQELYPAVVKAKYAGFSGIPSKSLHKLAQIQRKAKRAKPAPKCESPVKQEWNQDVKTTGLFDPKLAKQLPVNAMHQAKSSHRSASTKERKSKPQIDNKTPKVFREWTEMTRQETEEKGESFSHRQQVSLRDNLEFKFVADQEAIVTRLEQQLAQEQNARRALDRQFAERMKELERLKAVDRKVETAKREFLQRKEAEKRVSTAEERGKDAKPPLAAKGTMKPAVLSPTVALTKGVSSSQLHAQIETMRESLPKEAPGDIIPYEVRPDLRFGDIREEPTHDCSTPVRIPPKRENPKSISMKPAVYHPVLPSEVILSEVKAAITDSEIPELRQKLVNVRPTAIQSLPRNSEKQAFLSSLAGKIDLAEKYGAGERTIGIVAKVSARYIAYYADDLTGLLVEDLLADTVMELQRIEETTVARTQKAIRTEAGQMLDTLVSEFTDRVKIVQGKWTDKPKPMSLPELTTSVPVITIEDRVRLWEAYIPDRDLRRIRDYKREYEEFVRRQSGNTGLSEVYARVGDELLEEVMDEALGEFDDALGDFTGQVIAQELA